MKKRTLLALAVAMSVTAVAAANPFSDVPAKHWAYDSVMKLEKAGIVEGFGDGTFRGDRTMTRYEMAQIIARAMARVEKADAALKAELDKLSVEFAQELKTLGVRVTALENQTQNVKFSGDFRLRYDHTEDGYPLDGSGKPGDAWWKDKVVVPAGTKGATYRKGSTKNGQTARFRMQAEGKVNDNWTVVGRFVGNDDLRTNDEGSSAVKMDKLFVKGQMGSFGVRVGRIDVVGAAAAAVVQYVHAAVRGHQVHLQVALVGVHDIDRDRRAGRAVAAAAGHGDRAVDRAVVADGHVGAVAVRLRAAATAGGVAAGQADPGIGRIGLETHIVRACGRRGETAGLGVAGPVRTAVVGRVRRRTARPDVQVHVAAAARGSEAQVGSAGRHGHGVVQ